MFEKRSVMRSSISQKLSNSFRQILPICFTLTASSVFADFDYVANSSAGTVSVIDTTSNTVVATVPVGNTPVGVAVSPDGKFAYVTNEISSDRGRLFDFS